MPGVFQFLHMEEHYQTGRYFLDSPQRKNISVAHDPLFPSAFSALPMICC